MLTLKEVQDGMSKLNGWALEGSIITKEVSFDNFKQALDFVNKVGGLAEKHQHHPDIILRQNRVNLVSTTHEDKAITEKDLALAEEIDKV